MTPNSEKKFEIRVIVCLLVLGAFVLFYRLGDKDMWNGLESESAVAAWDMVETGRILIPHILNQPFVDNRPPGAWWLIAATYKLTGVRNTWTARLPTALAALICVFLVYAIGRRAANANAGFLSALILMGMLYFVLLGRMSQQDMLLTLATTLCLWAFWRSIDTSESGFRFIMAFQVFLGFGVLMKGPAVVINIFPSLAAYVLYSRCWRDVKWVSFIVTSPVSIGLSLWWYIYVWVGFPSMRDVLIHRFTDQSSIHVEAFYFYILRLPELLGPVLFLLPLLVTGWKKSSPEKRRGPFGLFTISALVMFFVYCLFASKRTHYLVSLLPPLSLALGLLIEDQRLDEGRYLPVSTLIIATLNPLILLIWNLTVAGRMGLDAGYQEWVMMVLLTGMVTCSWMMLRAGRKGPAWKTAWISCIIALAFFVGDVYSRAGNTMISRKFAEKVAQIVPEKAQIGTTDKHAALLFHLGRPVEFVEVANADKFLQDADHYLIVGKKSDLQKIDEKSRHVVLTYSPYRHRRPGYLLHGG